MTDMWTTRNKLIVVALVGVLIVVSIIAAVVGSRPKDNGIATTTISSPLSHTSTTVAPYYKADYTPGGEDAVNTTYSVFTLDKLNVPDAVKSALQFGVPDYLRKYQAPNVEAVYIHLDTGSVKFTSATDYRFNFYTDSPEGYFSYTVSPLDNNQSTTAITPIGGGW